MTRDGAETRSAPWRRPCARRWRSSAKRTVAQGGSFPECMQAVAKGGGGSISDIEAYRKAVQFYFPGAEIETTMRVRLCSDDAKPEGLLLKLDDFFGV